MSLLSRFRTLARIKPLPAVDLPEVAGSVAIILDGNGRWAKRRGLPPAAGHRAGARTVRRVVEAAIEVGVHDLSVFAFSTENWSRPPDEVDALMEIFAETIERELRSPARLPSSSTATAGGRNAGDCRPQPAIAPARAPCAASSRRRSRSESTICRSSRSRPRTGRALRTRSTR